MLGEVCNFALQTLMLSEVCNFDIQTIDFQLDVLPVWNLL